ncbi:hypothetical protein [Paractinoplanes durhamensis]|uniref:DUF732 domain-containing protein n=1 Tax=Paractinoplanes durhamensis TaxID=113563 RepID=A0ABQ3YR73_9ACTN|nr:hypothetical protein [Actinoplanes durhamensis]GIE00079.1 hypothetical protein Adu01nite_14290 [Actinoplanes durhamensis]
MHLTHVAMAAAVTVSIAGVSYAALSPDELEATARVVADQASCRTVDAAIVAFVGANGAPPASVADLAGYVKGDITAYSIVDGVAAGPGC